MLPQIKRSATPGEVVALMKNRYTAKAYDPHRHVSAEDIHAIVESGRLSASSMGLEPWHFLVLRPSPLWQAVIDHCWGYHPQPSHLVVLLGRNASHFTTHSEYVRHIHCDVQGRDPGALEARYETIERFLRHDLGLTSDEAVTGWVDRQVYIALGSMLIAAARLGVDSTAIEGMSVADVERALVEAGCFDPEDYHVVCALALGYTSRPAHRDKTRRQTQEVVTYIGADSHE